MGKKRKPAGELTPVSAVPDTTQLLAELRTLIDAGRARTAQPGDSGQEATRLRRANCRDSVATIDGRIWKWVHGQGTLEDGSVCRNDPRPGDCCGAVASVGLEPLHPSFPIEAHPAPRNFCPGQRLGPLRC